LAGAEEHHPHSANALFQHGRCFPRRKEIAGNHIR
jgi:hypothetical protein